ncbi:MAG: hypothetical protein M1836_002289 [Candelina mexicana]|nr:MAG: hypothetical protein M1836_002289 [Candelina mexicana]
MRSSRKPSRHDWAKAPPTPLSPPPLSIRRGLEQDEMAPLHNEPLKHKGSTLKEREMPSNPWFQLGDADRARNAKQFYRILYTFEDNRYNNEDLLNLRYIFDVECIWLLSNENEIPPADKSLDVSCVIMAAQLLAERLMVPDTKDSTRTIELQLRALVSALLLLDHRDTTHIGEEELGGLQETCGRLFLELPHGQLPDDPVSEGACFYLARSINEYAKSMKRTNQSPATPTSPAQWSIPSVTSLTGENENKRSFAALEAAFQDLWHSQQEQHQPIIRRCEIARAASVLSQRASILGSQDHAASYMKSLADHIGTLTIQKTAELLNETPRLQSPISPPGYDLITSTIELPPDKSAKPQDLNDYLLVYGLLDNVAQLTRNSSIWELDPAMYKHLISLLESTTNDPLQLKVIEVLLAHRESRPDNYEKLQSDIRTNRDTIASRRDHVTMDRWSLISEQVDLVYASLNSFDNEIISPWNSLDKKEFKSSLPIQIIPPSSPQPSLTQSNMDPSPIYEPCPTLERTTSRSPISPLETVPAIPIVTLQTPRNTTGPRQISVPSVQSRAADNASMKTVSTHQDSLKYQMAPNIPSGFTIIQDSHPHVLALEKNRMGILKRYFASGLSPDCNCAYFLGDKFAHVYHIADPWDARFNRPLLKFSPPGKQLFRAGSLGETVFAALTNEACHLRDFDPVNGESDGISFRPVVLEGWEPSCVTVDERGNQSTIAIGWEKGSIENARGRVTIHKLIKNYSSASLVASVDISADYPKTLSLSAEATMLACSTLRYNKVHAWRLPRSPEPMKQLCMTARPFALENGVEGVTSVTVFNTPGQGPHILCSTSYSSQRHNNEGECSFVAPAITKFPQYDSPLFHSLTQFVKAPPMQASTVAPQGNMAALLDRSGCIHVITLYPNANGGLHTERLMDRKIEPKLNSHLVSAMGSVRFNRSGTKLVAVDHKGKLVIVTFTNLHPSQQSLRSSTNSRRPAAELSGREVGVELP